MEFLTNKLLPVAVIGGFVVLVAKLIKDEIEHEKLWKTAMKDINKQKIYESLKKSREM